MLEKYIKVKEVVIVVKDYKKVLCDNEVFYAKNMVFRKFRESNAENLLEYASDKETLKYLF